MIDKDTKILMLAADEYGCGNFRILNNAKLLTAAGFNIKVGIIPRLNIRDIQDIVGEFDLVIYQRPSDPVLNDAIFNHAKYVIVETDDAIDQVTPDNEMAYQYYYIDKTTGKNSPGRQAYLDGLRNAKGVINSTSYLAKYNQRHNRNNVVFQNYVDSSLREWYPRTLFIDDYIRIGYAFSTSHKYECVPCMNGVADLLAKYDNVRLVLMSHPQVVSEIVQNTRLINVQDKLILQNPVDFHEYPKHLNFDIGLAPIADTEFNRGKSNLKWLENSAKCTSTVCSPCVPYLTSIKNGENGLITKNNTPEEWAKTIEKLILDESLNNDISFSAYQTVIKNYMLENNIHKYIECLNELVDKASNTIVKSNIPRRQPCPLCNSGKLYKNCCERRVK